MDGNVTGIKLGARLYQRTTEGTTSSTTNRVEGLDADNQATMGAATLLQLHGGVNTQYTGITTHDIKVVR
jgi:hypothetical protein